MESGVDGDAGDESKNASKDESADSGVTAPAGAPTLETIQDVVKSNLPLIIAVAIGVIVITAVSGLLWYRKKRNSGI
jgi:hypothetical protein